MLELLLPLDSRVCVAMHERNRSPGEITDQGERATWITDDAQAAAGCVRTRASDAASQAPHSSALIFKDERYTEPLDTHGPEMNYNSH